MTKTLGEEYRRLRKANPGLPAKQAILWAKGNLKPLTLDWAGNPGNHIAVGRTTEGEFEVRVIIDYDQFSDPSVSLTDEDTGIRNPNFRWTGDAWDTRHDKRFLELELGSTVKDLAVYYRKAGDARNVAWERARQSLQDEAEVYLDDYFTEYTIRAEAYLRGVRVGEGGFVSGYQMDPSESNEKQFDDFAVEADCVAEAIEDARQTLRELDVKIHASGVLTTA